jgi:hypothetical protein
MKKFILVYFSIDKESLYLALAYQEYLIKLSFKKKSFFFQ